VPRAISSRVSSGTRGIGEEARDLLRRELEPVVAPELVRLERAEPRLQLPLQARIRDDRLLEPGRRRGDPRRHRRPDREHRADHHDPGQQAHRVVAEPQHERVQRGVLPLAHVDGVGQCQAPAGTGIPRVLRQRLQPDARVGEVRPVRCEEERQARLRAGQRDRPGGEEHDEHEERRDQHAGRSLDPSHPERDYGDPDRHRDGMGEHRPTAAGEAVPERPGDLLLELSGQRGPEVPQRPTRDHRVVEHDRGRGPRDPRAHPCPVPSDQPAERAHRTVSRRLPHREFHQEQRHRPEQQEHHPGDQERAAAVRRRDAREPPDVAGPDRHAEHGDHHSPSRGEHCLACSHGRASGAGDSWGRSGGTAAVYRHPQTRCNSTRSRCPASHASAARRRQTAAPSSHLPFGRWSRRVARAAGGATTTAVRDRPGDGEAPRRGPPSAMAAPGAMGGRIMPYAPSPPSTGGQAPSRSVATLGSGAGPIGGIRGAVALRGAHPTPMRHPHHTPPRRPRSTAATPHRRCPAPIAGYFRFSKPPEVRITPRRGGSDACMPNRGARIRAPLPGGAQVADRTAFLPGWPAGDRGLSNGVFVGASFAAGAVVPLPEQRATDGPAPEPCPARPPPTTGGSALAEPSRGNRGRPFKPYEAHS
jgi:hypothetical protein